MKNKSKNNKINLSVLQKEALKLLNDSAMTGYQIAKSTGITEATISNYKRCITRPARANANALIQFLKGYDLHEAKKTNDVVQEEYSINESGDGKPYYDVDFTLGLELVENDQTVNPAYYINFAKYKNADFWINATGDSMSPLINHGDTVALRRIENWRDNILFGEVYAVVTNEFRTIKKIRRSARGDNYYRFVPENTEEFDEQDVLADSICFVYKVLGCAKIM